jgi:flagellar hook-length control protein FliK
MQTQSIQSQQPNKAQPPKSAPLPNNDFKQALTLEIERTPVCAAPEQPAPQAATSKTQLKNAQGAKPAQNAAQAGKAEQSGQAEASESPAKADETVAADGKPAADGAATADDKADAGEEAAPADPAAGLLAMLAAYGQLAGKAEAKADVPETPAGTDAAARAALQADGFGKPPTLADLAADARAGKAGAEGTSALQDALAEKTGADRLLKAGSGLELPADKKAESFAAHLAATADTAPAAQPVAQPAAQALAATMQAANAVASSQLQARVGSNAWEQQLGQKVVWMVAGGDQSASLTLNPPDLGPLQVVLNVSNDAATATFTAHQPETRQAIENALPKLREMMSEAGIALGNATVSAGSQEQQQAFAEQARGGRGGGGGRSGNGGDAGGPDEGQPVVRRTILGAVDTFA